MEYCSAKARCNRSRAIVVLSSLTLFHAGDLMSDDAIVLMARDYFSFRLPVLSLSRPFRP